ncbi:EVE domain-containing protein [Palleronia rufa]|uniref:EVE domain-containing protein n=1 Tax=Palleronia rufa TaxID=1530186 RepID=UPI0005630087|nr:EVE domain-containing protein [Palleronia rufa]
MRYWLFKSEPSDWSWEDQLAKGDAGEDWTGVRNYQARNQMRQMALGDRGLFYHSQTERACVGIVEIIAKAHPDPTDDSGRWDCVTVRALASLPKPVTLDAAKANPALAGMALVTNPRLSVQPVTRAEFDAVVAMSGEP